MPHPGSARKRSNVKAKVEEILRHITNRPILNRANGKRPVNFRLE